MAELSKTIEDQAKVLEQTQTGKTSKSIWFRKWRAIEAENIHQFTLWHVD